MLLAPSSQDEADVVEEGEDIACIEPSQPVSPACEELLEIMACAMARLDLTRGRLDEWFLSSHNHPAPMSHPYLPCLP
ncbi:hypothetical protein PO909_022166 [Leuciscus waleckii]